MDAYQDGQTTRLVQSHSDSAGLGSTGFVYDNSLAVLAFLRRGKRDDIARAMFSGTVSSTRRRTTRPTATAACDKPTGSVRSRCHMPTTIRTLSGPDGTVNLVGAPWFFIGSSVSDMCWVGIALAQLYARTRKSRYLAGSLQLAQWIVNNAFDTVGLGGYSYGVDGNNQRLSLKKLTEHNADVYGFFTNLLAPLTGDSNWTKMGQHALEFVEAMWNADDGFFYTGSNDGKTIDTSVVLEEVQSEAYLAMLDPRYAVSLDWTKTNLVGTDTPQSLNSSFVWQPAVHRAELQRRRPARDREVRPVRSIARSRRRMVRGQRAHGCGAARPQAQGRARFANLPRRRRDRVRVPESRVLAQSELGRNQTINGLAIPNGSGVVAASSVLNTGTGFSYFPNFISPPRRGT